jgi:hypothetical protein
MEVGMSWQLWGCYAVNDHLQKRPFVADVLLFDRLVIPVRPQRDRRARAAWKHWEPEKQEELLEILGGIAYRVPWSSKLRDKFNRAWSAADAAGEVEIQADAGRNAYAGGVSPEAAAITAGLLSKELTDKALNQRDVLALAVYASPVKFDEEWYFSRAWPFIGHHKRAVSDQPSFEVETAVPVDEYNLAKLLVARFAIPENPRRSDVDMLKEAVDIAGEDDMIDWRQSYHTWIASMAHRGLSDKTLVREMKELVDAYNSAAKKKKRATITRQSATVVGSGVGMGAAIWGGPLAVAAGAPIATAGDVVASRLYGVVPEHRIAAGALLAQAAKGLSS